jgi:hypothetical protein
MFSKSRRLSPTQLASVTLALLFSAASFSGTVALFTVAPACAVTA